MIAREQTRTESPKAGKYSYEFETRERPGERTCLVISCFSPSGNCSRITVEEDLWPAFARGFQLAAQPIVGERPADGTRRAVARLKIHDSAIVVLEESRP